MTMSRTGRIGRAIAAAGLTLGLSAGVASAVTVANQRENTYVGGAGIIDLTPSSTGPRDAIFSFTWSGVDSIADSVAATIEFEATQPFDIFLDQYDTSDPAATTHLSLEKISGFGATAGSGTVVTGTRDCAVSPSAFIAAAAACSFVSGTGTGVETFLPGTNPILADLEAGFYRIGLSEIGLTGTEDPFLPEFGPGPEFTNGDGVVLRVEEIPLPATHLMLIGALGAVVALRRHRRGTA